VDLLPANDGQRGRGTVCATLDHGGDGRVDGRKRGLRRQVAHVQLVRRLSGGAVVVEGTDADIAADPHVGPCTGRTGTIVVRPDPEGVPALWHGVGPEVVKSR